MPGSGQTHWGQSGKFLAVTKSVTAPVFGTNESIGLEAFVAAPVASQQQVAGNSVATPSSDTHQSPDVLPAGRGRGGSLMIKRTGMATNPTAAVDPWLESRLREYPDVGEIRGHIRGEDHFREVEEQYRDLARHQPGESVPENDPTLPTTDDEMVQYVDRLLKAMVDFSDVDKTKRMSGMTGSKPSEMIEEVVRVKLSVIELELLCWNLLVCSPLRSWCVSSGN